jgi:cardiolipin synthase
MMHAKSAVVDGHWSRVGSTNLNLASWLGNWELDICVDDTAFGAAMEQVYLADLESSSEIVLEEGRRVHPSAEREPPARARRVAPGSAGRAAAAALELGGRVGAAMTRSALAPAEVRSLTLFAAALFGLAALAFLLPRLVAVPLGAAAAWLGVAFLARAARVRRAQARAPAPRGDADSLR